MDPRTDHPGGTRPWPAALALFVLLSACSLEVNDLPENNLPIVGAISMEPELLAPLDSFTLSVSAEDPDGDDIYYLWHDGGAGSWVDDERTESLVLWVAPANFTGVDSVHFSVNVYDFDLSNTVERLLDVAVIPQTGNLRVLVVDLQGDSAFVRLVAPTVQDTTPVATSDHTFTDLLWGIQSVYNLDSENYFGVLETGSSADDQELIDCYSETLYVEANTTKIETLVVASKSLLVLPGDPGDGLIKEIQVGIDHCVANGLDSLLIKRRDYELPAQSVPGYEGSEENPLAAILLTEADLTLAAFPGDGPIWLDVGASNCDFGFYIAGRSGALLIENIAVLGAGASGAYLYHSSGSFDTVLFDDCGAAGVFLGGSSEDTLHIRRSELRGNDHGLSLSGGHLEADSLSIEDSHWYGLWLRDGASANLSHLTVVVSDLAGLFTLDTGAVNVDRCLFALGGRGIFNQSGPSPLLSCNLLWENDISHYSALVIPGADDLLEDPLFCDTEGGDWRVEADSPALTGDCAPIGAWGNCDSPGSPFAEGSR